MDFFARAGIFSAPVFAPAWAECQSPPKNPRASWKSRKVAEFALGDVLVHLRQQLVQLAAGDIAFHLFIPRVILPVIEATGDLRAFREGQRGNCRFDFSYRAHTGKLSAKRKGVNPANLPAIQRDHHDGKKKNGEEQNSFAGNGVHLSTTLEMILEISSSLSTSTFLVSAVELMIVCS